MDRSPVRFVVFADVCASVFVALWLLAHYLPGIYLERMRAKLENGAKVGWSRAQVIEHLGKPGMVAKTKKDLDYWRRDRSYEPPPTSPFQKEVLVYTDYVWRMYVYIGKDGHVSHVQMART